MTYSIGLCEANRSETEPPWMRTLAGAITNAMIARHTHNPGKMRNPRAIAKSRSFGFRSQLAVMRNPETAKKPSTPTCSMSCSNGRYVMVRPVSGHECQKMTLTASASRHAFSALFRGSKTWPSVKPLAGPIAPALVMPNTSPARTAPWHPRQRQHFHRVWSFRLRAPGPDRHSPTPGFVASRLPATRGWSSKSGG